MSNQTVKGKNEMGVPVVIEFSGTVIMEADVQTLKMFLGSPTA